MLCVQTSSQIEETEQSEGQTIHFLHLFTSKDVVCLVFKNIRPTWWNANSQCTFVEILIRPK